MGIDLGLGGVVKDFISKVGDPKKVDHIIQTHRIVKGLWMNGSKFLNSYTLHNEEHALKLIELSINIIRRIDYLQLKNNDYYILFLSCYLHDISMVIHPDLQVFSHPEEKSMLKIEPFVSEMEKILEQQKVTVKNLSRPEMLINFWKDAGQLLLRIFNSVYGHFEQEVRDSHAEESGDFLIKKRHELFNYLDETIVSAVARAGKDHGRDTHTIYDLVSEAHKDVVSTKYISIVLRLADLMDVSNDRVNYHLLHENVAHLSPTSKFHWISHLITDEITLIPEYKLVERRVDKCVREETENDRFDPDLLYVKETLHFYFVLNVKSQESLPQKGMGDKCSRWCRKKYKYNPKRHPEKFKDYEGLSISIGNEHWNEVEDDRKENLCHGDTCPLMCQWMVEKHRWMFNELAKLKKYLNAVNHRPFETEIEVNILFKKLFTIDAPLFDDVRRYLRKEHNE